MNFFAYKTYVRYRYPGVVIKSATNHAIMTLVKAESVRVIQTSTWLIPPEKASKHFIIPPTKCSKICRIKSISQRVAAEIVKLLYDLNVKHIRKEGATKPYQSHLPFLKRTHACWDYLRTHHPLFAKWYKYEWKLKT
jgi:hypothetical protein